MPLCSWDTAPEPVRTQVKRFVRDSRAILGESLTGIYLHGSLALGCFNPERSDIDLLVVVRRPMAPETKRLMAGLLLAQSTVPSPLEVSWVLEAELHHWRHPFPYELHYSEGWRQRFEANLTRLDWEVWNGGTKTDRDLAAHFTILERRGGVVLYGPPVQGLFPQVPMGDYIDALLYDFESARDEIVANPVYGVLNLLRVYWYLLEGEISSKEEAGRWGARTLPEPDLRALAETAADLYAGTGKEAEFDPEALSLFARYVDNQVERLLVRRHEPPVAPGAAEPLECGRCHVGLNFAGINHLADGMPLRVFYCPECGQVEFFLQPAERS